MATVRGGSKAAIKIAELGKKLSDAQVVRIGFLENAKYPSGESVAQIAAFNEYGIPSHGQPPRPAFRNMIAAKQAEWPAAIAGLLKANDYDTRRTLELTGAAIAGQLRESISTIMEPPLAPSTVKRKGFDKPWIDTGHLLASVDFEIKE